MRHLILGVVFARAKPIVAMPVPAIAPAWEINWRRFVVFLSFVVIIVEATWMIIYYCYVAQCVSVAE